MITCHKLPVMIIWLIILFLFCYFIDYLMIIMILIIGQARGKSIISMSVYIK